MSSAVEADLGTSTAGAASVVVAAETEVETHEAAGAVAQATLVAVAAPHWANASQDIPISRCSRKTCLQTFRGTARTSDRHDENSPNLVLSSTAEAAPSTPHEQLGMVSAEDVVGAEGVRATVKEADWAGEAAQRNQSAAHRWSIHPAGTCIDCTNWRSWVVAAAAVRLSRLCSMLSMHHRCSTLSTKTPARRS